MNLKKKKATATNARLLDEPSEGELSKSTLQASCATQNTVDFKQLLEDHRARTEMNLPFTAHHVEDAVFVGNRHLISLEFI